MNDLPAPSESRDPGAGADALFSERDALIGEPVREPHTSAETSHRAHTRFRGRRQPTWLPAIFAAAVVGAAVTLAGRFEYRCVAELEANPGSPGRSGVELSEVRRFLWEKAPTLSGAQGIPARWSVSQPRQHTLAVNLTTPERAAGMTDLRWMVEAYLDEARRQAERIRTTPSDVEAEWTVYLGTLRERMDDLQAHVQEATRALPAEVGDDRQQALVAQWSSLREGFSAARGELALAMSDVARLEREGAPASALVLETDREQAFRADQALQQDLKELAVALTDMKLQMLNVWQRSASLLERLVTARQALDTGLERQRQAASVRNQNLIASASDSAAPSDRHFALLGMMLLPLEDYTAALKTFSADWTGEFTRIQKTDVDPRDPTILDGYTRVHSRLHEFLFTAAKRLGAMREAVERLAADPADDARLHVQLSEMLRLFESLQTAHYQFEFAAGQLETPANFRLDAAYQAARGLHRRARERMDNLDETLRERALERARTLRLAELAAARTTIEQVRQETDRMVDDLLSVQEQLMQSATRSEQFLKAMVKVEAAAARLKVTESDLGRVEERLAALRTERLSSAPTADLRLTSCVAEETPVNLGERLRLGGIAACLTLLTVLLGQWWTLRGSS